ncbi:MAG: hypothetical protein Q7S64_02300, partial [bacterium]|nr:hypothetical protein [bacterium]
NRQTPYYPPLKTLLMQPFWPTKEEFLARPRRLSRLFVLLFIFSATLNALLIIFAGYQTFSTVDAQKKLESIASTNLNLALKYKAERDDLQLSVAEKNTQLKQLNSDLVTAKKDLGSAQKQLTTLNDQIKSQKSQLSANSSELDALRARPPLFKFISSTGRDVSADETAVKEIVTTAYDAISNIYGKPYLLNQIKIEFADNLQINGAVGEINIANTSSGIEITIKLLNFDKNSNEDVNTLVHELIHGFHGVAALESPALEEGMTVAATDVVLTQLSEQGTISSIPSFITLSEEEANTLNGSLGQPSSGNAFYSSAKVGVYYQLAGWSWFQLYRANHNFFKSFNEALYKKVQQGENVTDETVRTIIRENVSTVNGQSGPDFVAGQIMFNPV